MAYSTERRAAVLKKLEPPHAVPLRQLAKNEGISEATLHAWRRDARSKGRLLPDADAGPEGWTSRDKFAAVIETAALNEADLATYCRQRGLYAEQIQTWRAACEQANDWARASSLHWYLRPIWIATQAPIGGPCLVPPPLCQGSCPAPRDDL